MSQVQDQQPESQLDTMKAIDDMEGNGDIQSIDDEMGLDDFDLGESFGHRLQTPEPHSSLPMNSQTFVTPISFAAPRSKPDRVARPLYGDKSYKDDEDVQIIDRPATSGAFSSIFGGPAPPPRPPVSQDDDKDDVMIIDACKASTAARARWDRAGKEAKKITTVVIADDVHVKKENTIETKTNSSSQADGSSDVRQAGGSSDDRQNDNSSGIRQLDDHSDVSIDEPSQSSISSQPSDPSSGAQKKTRTPDEVQAFKLAAQDRLMQQRRERAAQNDGMPPHAVAESSSTAARRLPSSATGSHLPRSEPSPSMLPTTEHDDDISRDPSAQVDAAMGFNDDHAWMEQDEDDDDESYKKMKGLKDLLEGKLKSNTISDDEQMELCRLRSKIATIDNLRHVAARGKNAPPDGDEDELFVSETDLRRDIIGGHRRKKPRKSRRQDDDDLSDFENDGSFFVMDEALRRMMQETFIDAGPAKDLGLRKDDKPRKRRQKRPSNARDYYHQQEDKRRENERTKKQKQKAREITQGSASRKPKKSPKAQSTAKVRAKAKGKGKGKEKENGKGKGKGKKVVKKGTSLLRNPCTYGNGNQGDPVVLRILENLKSSDPISDALVHRNAAPEPVIEGRQNKKSQFAALFANIPDISSEIASSNPIDDKKKLREASKSFGYAKCKAQDGKWLITGMKSLLYHHQLLGAQWMVQRELSSQAPHGGLLADSMGLGKTVQTLACMIGNPPGERDVTRKIKATLIVAPATVVEQWLSEIPSHAEPKRLPKIMQYKTSSKIPFDVLRDLDVVVTSYTEVMKQFPWPSREDREKINRTPDGYTKWWKDAYVHRGDLHKIDWYRVVLDESQLIKNNTGRTSMACQNLRSVYRWCLTGTPLLNRLEELFPYLRFLKADYSMDWPTFSKYFCDPNNPECYSRITTLLSYTMMRRTMKTTILNRPIITLPEPHPLIEYIHFSPEEQIIYRITENRFRANLSAYFARGEARRVYGIFFVQLLRLRQCTSHPYMLERTIKESWTLEDVSELKSKLTKLNNRSKGLQKFHDQCQIWVETSEASRAARKAAGEVVDDDNTELLPFGQGSYGHRFSFDKPLATLSEKELYDRVTCSLCSDAPNHPTETSCGHIFCKECIETHIHDLNTVEDVQYPTCPTCNIIISGTNLLSRTELGLGQDDDDDASSSQGGRRRGGSAKSAKAKSGKEKRVPKESKGRDALGFEPYTADSTWIMHSDDPRFGFTPSAKTTALKAILVKGFMEAPLDKVVVYVQFRALARIVGRICASENWGFLYLLGDSSLDHRAKVIRRFKEDDHIKVLIAGLKCGGLGLNFPWANRCISLDLWWNHAVEQQAFGRIFRIGQQKETYMTRIVVRNSVDMRMLTMQLHKLQNLEKAITDGDEAPSTNLSMKELANLFGFLKTDGDDNIISIEPDYEDSEGRIEGLDDDDNDEEGEGEERQLPSWMDNDGDGDRDRGRVKEDEGYGAYMAAGGDPDAWEDGHEAFGGGGGGGYGYGHGYGGAPSTSGYGPNVFGEDGEM